MSLIDIREIIRDEDFKEYETKCRNEDIKEFSLNDKIRLVKLIDKFIINTPKIKDIPSLSIHYNINNVFCELYIGTSKCRDWFFSNVVDEIRQTADFIFTQMKEKETYEIKFIKPKTDYFIDLTDDYYEIEKCYNEMKKLNFNFFYSKSILEIIDLRNTQKQYSIQRNRKTNTHYLFEFSTEFIIIDLNQENDIFNCLALPFLTGLDIKEYQDIISNVNAILGLKVYKIPNSIHLPKVLDWSKSKREVEKYYKINSKFVKEIKSYYNKPKSKKVLTDNELIKLFENNNFDKRTKKVKKTKKILKEVLKVETDFKPDIKTDIKTENLPFILKYSFKSIEKHDKTFKHLFKNLLETNPRFKQLVDFENIKEINIYKDFSKTYSNYLYFNGEMNNINYHFYLNKEISKITAITRIINVI